MKSPRLPARLVFPAYFPVIVAVPVELGVNMTAQLAETPPPDRVQLVESNVPTKLLVNITVPVGVTGVPPPMSVTVTVQVVAEPTRTADGVQVTLVNVGNLTGNSSTLALAASGTHRLPAPSNATSVGAFRPFCVVAA